MESAIPWLACALPEEPGTGGHGGLWRAATEAYELEVASPCGVAPADRSAELNPAGATKLAATTVAGLPMSCPLACALEADTPIAPAFRTPAGAVGALACAFVPQLAPAAAPPPGLTCASLG